MGVEIKNSGSGFLASVDGQMNIYFAAGLKNELIEALKASNELCLDLSGVSEIDTTGVQLLLLMKKEAIGKTLKILHSPSTKGAAELYGIAGLFDPQP
ncbi:MAG: STAS domain-containing protein [Deltaproteobacteria bacterium]